MRIARRGKLDWLVVQACVAQCVVSTTLRGAEGLADTGVRPMSAPPGEEDWSDEPAEAMRTFAELKRYERDVRVREEDKGKDGYAPREVAWKRLSDGWGELIEGFPASKLRIHAYWRLGNLYAGEFGVKRNLTTASRHLRRAFELDPALLSLDTAIARSQYASASTNAAERASRTVRLYRWLKTEAPQLVEGHPPRINGFGYYAPPIPGIYPRSGGPIRGEDPIAARRKFLGSLVESKTKSIEARLTSAAEYGEAEIGWMILSELGDLLPEEVQARIAEVAGTRGPVPQAPKPTVEDLAAEAHFDAARTVLDPTMAERLGNADVYLPPAPPANLRSALPAMRESSQWIRRVLVKKWWPRHDRPKDYIPVTSPRGYDCVYRHWLTGGTSFLAQSAHGWVELSLRKTPGSGHDPRLDRPEVEARLAEAMRIYLSDPHKVLDSARLELKPASYGYEGRLRLTAALRHGLDQADRDRQTTWLRGMTVQTNGTSFLFRFQPKTDSDGKVREDRTRWFGSAGNRQTPPGGDG